MCLTHHINIRSSRLTFFFLSVNENQIEEYEIQEREKNSNQNGIFTLHDYYDCVYVQYFCGLFRISTIVRCTNLYDGSNWWFTSMLNNDNIMYEFNSIETVNEHSKKHNKLTPPNKILCTFQTLGKRGKY